MIDAEMKQKLPEVDNKEDVLTSNVFGLLELVNYKGLVELLATAKNINGDTCEKLHNKSPIETLELWKRFGKSSEPDIFVTLEDGTQFIIEVKYYGQEHNKKIVVNGEEKIDGQLKKYLNITETDFIIYLTQNYNALNELSAESKEHAEDIYHIHWEEFNEKLKNMKNLTQCEERIFKKLTDYLDYKDFVLWQGFRYRKEYDNIDLTVKGFYNE